jgi:ADP-heptose:LPS heptosyltransferase
VATAKREKNEEIQSVLVIHQGAIGDFILALPALRVLRKTFPKARSVIMGYPRILELVKKRFYAEEIVSVDRKGMASFFVRGGGLDADLSRFFSTFDLIVVFTKDGEGPLIGNLRRVSEGRILHVNPFPPEHERIHLSEHLLRELRRYSLSIPGQEPRLYLTRADQERGTHYCQRKGLTISESTRTIVVHPGSGSKKKVWPVERFVEVVRQLKRSAGSRILVLLGPAEGPEVQKAFEAIEWEMGPAAPIFLKGLSLLELASVIGGSCLFIGNDSGITHMAAALGVPTVAIFGPSDPKIWSPRGKRVGVVRSKIACSPCSQEKFFDCQDIQCLKQVEVEDVLAEVSRLAPAV